jgi:hypothetical protein
MSGIHTYAEFAILDARSGLGVDCYASLGALVEAALYRYVAELGQNTPHNAPSVMCDSILKRYDAMVAGARQQIIQNYDPARLRAPELWPWHDAQSGALIQAERWYGFSDSGGLWGSRSGYETLERAQACLTEDAPDDDGSVFSTNPEDLGSVACCILTGRQYVDRLYSLCETGGTWPLEDYGKWSEPPHVGSFGGSVVVTLRVPRMEGLEYKELAQGVLDACAEFTGTCMHPCRPAIAACVNKAVKEK